MVLTSLGTLAARAAPDGVRLPKVGPRELYESRLGEPPRTLGTVVNLGYRWRGTAPQIAGTAAYSHGEFVYNDFPFDDTGPDTIPTVGDQTSGLCGNTDSYRYGDYAYPDDARHRRNAADLTEVRIGRDGRSYHVLFRLQTLIDPTTSVAALYIDSDRNAGTGRVPGGFEHVVEVHVAGRRAVGSLDGRPVGAAASIAFNTLEARFPVSAIRSARWRIGAAAGTWDGKAWSAVVDLAFVDEPVADAAKASCWLDRAQSAAIAGGELPTAALDARRLGRGYSDQPTVRRGPMVRLHVPSIDIGEGVSGQPRYGQDASQSIYRGRYQPYSIYVPKSYDPSRPNPLIMLLHCLTCNHMTYHLASWPGLRELAEARGAVIVTPLAYGEGGHYEGEAEWDVFDVLSDVSARYRIDRDRLYLTGFSMGSLGTYRLGLLYPDLWARAYGVGNYTNPFCVTVTQAEPNYCDFAPFNYWTILENARNLPFGVLNGWLDYLTPHVGATEIADRLDELGYAYRFWEYPTRSHEAMLHGLTTNVTNPFLGNARRIKDPAHVTYAVDRTMHAPEWHIVPAQAYWVSDIRLAKGVDRGTVDARSGRGTVRMMNELSDSGESEAGPYMMRGRDGVLQRLNGPNRLTLVLRGIASLRVDPRVTGLVLSRRLRVSVDTDTPVRLVVTGHPGGIRVRPGRHTVWVR